MGSYVNGNLITNERVIKEAQPSWISQWPSFLFGCFFILVALSSKFGFMWFLAFIFIGSAILKVISTELALTNKRLIAKAGFIRRETIELRLEKVESLMISQGIFGRILNYGSIVVVGTGGTKTPIPYISNPANFRMMVNEFLANPAQFG